MKGEEWRAEVKRAQAASAAAGRRQRYRPRARGVQAVNGVGMVRIPPPAPNRRPLSDQVK
jgi:hypothetical protein